MSASWSAAWLSGERLGTAASESPAPALYVSYGMCSGLLSCVVHGDWRMCGVTHRLRRARGAARLNFQLSVCVACRCIVCHAPSVWVMCVWLEKRDRKMETLCFQCLFPRYYVTSGSVLASSSPIIKILGG